MRIAVPKKDARSAQKNWQKLDCKQLVCKLDVRCQVRGLQAISWQMLESRFETVRLHMLDFNPSIPSIFACSASRYPNE